MKMDFTGLSETQKHKNIMDLAMYLASKHRSEVTAADKHFMQILAEAEYLTVQLPSIEDGPYPHTSLRPGNGVVAVAEPKIPADTVTANIWKEYEIWMGSPTEERIPTE